MLGKTQMQEIQDLKLRGYIKSEIITYYEGLGMKPPSRPTISKHCVAYNKNPRNRKRNSLKSEKDMLKQTNPSFILCLRTMIHTLAKKKENYDPDKVFGYVDGLQGRTTARKSATSSPRS